MEQLIKLKKLWEDNLKLSVRLKAPRGEQEMIMWFIKTIDDSINKSKIN